MANGTRLNTGIGGDLIQDEDIRTGQGVGGGTKVPVSKIYIGSLDRSDGPVSQENPFPVYAQRLEELFVKQNKILVMILMALDNTVNEDDLDELEDS